MTKSKAKQNKEKTANLKYAKIPFGILLVAQAATSFLFLSILYKLNLLQIWQFVVVVFVLVGLFTLNLYKLIISKRAGQAIRIFCAILAILLTIGGAFGYKYIRQAVNFIESVTEQHEYETITYQVRVLKKSNYQKIDDLANKKVGFLTTDPNIDETKKQLAEKVVSKTTDFDTLGAMLLDINEKDTAAVVINQSYLDLLAEAQNTFEDDSRVVYEFEIRVEKSHTEKTVDVTNEPFILYISGSDSRGAITERARSDVNILAVVNPRTAKILLVNIPRDSYVYLHGITSLRDKLTDAGLYGIEMSKNTIEDLLDIDINYTVKVGFETVIRVVDEIDGIEIESDKAYSTKDCNFVVGKQTINSTCALTFARTRKIYSAGGDRQRGKNQQQMLAQIIQKVSDPHYLTRFPSILKAAEGTFETSLTYDEITGFIRHQLNDLRHWSIESIQVDGKGAMLPLYTWGPDSSSWSIVLNEDTVTAAQAKIYEYLAATK